MPLATCAAPALVATISDGNEPAERYLERYRDRVAVTYCWASEEHDLTYVVCIVAQLPIDRLDH